MAVLTSNPEFVIFVIDRVVLRWESRRRHQYTPFYLSNIKKVGWTNGGLNAGLHVDGNLYSCVSGCEYIEQ